LATLSASALIVIGAGLAFRQDETQAHPIRLVRSTEAALQRWLRSQLVEWEEVVVVEEEGEEEETGVDEVVVDVVECRVVAVLVLVVLVVGVGVGVEGVGEGEIEVKLEEVKAGVMIAVVATVVRVVVTKTSIASTSVSNQVVHLLSLHHTQHRLLIKITFCVYVLSKHTLWKWKIVSISAHVWIRC